MNLFSKTVGLHRIVEDKKSTPANPYDAWSLNPKLPLKDDEIKIKVISINLDSTSARQILEKNNGNELHFKLEIFSIIGIRGKMHNPTTNSGGVILGEVIEIGSERKNEVTLNTKVVTLVSNTLVPLCVEKIIDYNHESHQVEVEGFAILPKFARYACVPEDLPLSLALTVFDVCGVVPQVERLSTYGSTVVVLGASGKAGLLAVYAAARAVATIGKVIGIVPTKADKEFMEDVPNNVEILVCDAREVVSLENAVLEYNDGEYADVVIDCANVTGVEIGAAACCKDKGTVYFFNMATRFQAAALGAELVNRDIQYVIGYGLLPQAETKALALIYDEPGLRAKFEKRM